MFGKAVHNVDVHTSAVKSGDNASGLKLSFWDGDGKEMNITGSIDYFRITRDKKGYYEVTDYEADGNILTYRLPNVPKGRYYIEIRDSLGRIYPANRDVVVDVMWSVGDGQEAYYTSYKQEILGDVEPIIIDHMTSNVELYKGEKGDKGESVFYDALTGQEHDYRLEARDGHLIFKYLEVQ